MAASRKRGKLIFVLSFSLLVSDFFYFPRLSCLVLASEIDPSLNSNSIIEKDSKNGIPFRENLIDNDQSSNPDVVLLRNQQLQLEKLEELVGNLTQLVSRLESQFVEGCGKVKTSPLSSSSSHDRRNDAEDKRLSSEEEEGAKGGGAVLVTKYNTFWSERFQFMSAVKLSSRATCISVLPYKDFEGLTKYFAVGDDEGKLFVFLRSGDVSLQFNTCLESERSSPITAMVSYLSVYKNESMIVTGHDNGVIIMHRVWETFSNDELSSLHVERVGKFEVPDSSGTWIKILEVHHIGRKRYVLASDANGKITVFKDDGTVFGSAVSTRRPVVFLKQRLLFLTETGAGSLDLRTMRLKETECEGLNGSFVETYVFDAMDRSKAFGITSDGDLIQTWLLGDAMNFKCRIRSKKKLELEGPLSLQAIKGYLLISNNEKVFVYNVSSQHYVRTGGLRLMFSAGHDEIISSFSNNNNPVDGYEKTNSIPLITGDHEKLVIISLGNGYVAMYRSNLPVYKNEFNSILWTSPVLFFILFLFGAYHFFANKKEALTSWGPDDPFTSGSVTSGTPLGGSGGAGERLESSRNSEIMDLRAGGGLRGSSRYVSPPRYPGGAANSYRTGPDSDSRPPQVDARFRTTSELKFRGNVDGAGVQKRRESLFVNSQAVDDGN